jgi:hypothetical protein
MVEFYEIYSLTVFFSFYFWFFMMDFIYLRGKEVVKRPLQPGPISVLGAKLLTYSQTEDLRKLE